MTIGEGATFEGIIDIINKKAYKYNGFEREEVEIPEIRIAEVDEVFNEIVEVIAQTDDVLMEKYFSGEEFTHEEFLAGFTTAMLEGSAVPLIAGSAATGAGIDILMDTIIDFMPSPSDERARYGFRHEDDKFREVSVDAPFSAVVFKTIVDPFVGKISIFKVISGSVKRSDELFNVTKNVNEKIGGMFYLQGKNQVETDELIAGDIGAISKLSATQTGDTLADKQDDALLGD